MCVQQIAEWRFHFCNLGIKGTYTPKKDIMQIGFIGIGLMGSRMAKNLIKAGHTLTLYNRTEARALKLQGPTATIAQSPGAAAIDKPLVITMLSDPPTVREVADAFLPFMKKDAIWMNCSTIDPNTARDMGQMAQRFNVRYVDAPVAGSTAPAAAGELVFLVGGQPEDVKATEPVTQVCGKAVHHLGKVGQGAAAKMVINLLLAQQMTIFTESMQLATALGLKQDQMLDILIGGPVTAPYLAHKREKITTDQYEPEFPLKWMLKDVRLALQCAREQGLDLPVGHASQQLYEAAAKASWSEKDFSAIWSHLLTPDH